MFPRTAISEKAAKNPLICSHEQMVSKMARRHQFHQLQPCGDGSIAVKAVTLDITGFSRLHSTCLIERKGRNAYVETYRGYIWG